MDNVTVTPKIDSGTLVLELHYAETVLFQDKAYEELGAELIKRYREERQRAGTTLLKPSCVVHIVGVQTAGSVIVRALFDLWEEVQGAGGRLVCVGYPPAYLDSLHALGLTQLPSFVVVQELPDALKKAAS